MAGSSKNPEQTCKLLLIIYNMNRKKRAKFFSQTRLCVASELPRLHPNHMHNKQHLATGCCIFNFALHCNHARLRLLDARRADVFSVEDFNAETE